MKKHHLHIMQLPTLISLCYMDKHRQCSATSRWFDYFCKMRKQQTCSNGSYLSI
uniref:Uncharacterized protein n=1 Tax=Setaria viridis TaxID=4556 RepID=A0A4U6WGT2_SETVI|nr:hypothetical protein SEVIR_1G315600v2 [Setaria viridis]